MTGLNAPSIRVRRKNVLRGGGDNSVTVSLGSEQKGFGGRDYVRRSRLRYSRDDR
jgi:hypothetical protein